MAIKKTALLASASIAAIFVATTALANDRATSWSGLYVGLHAGFGEASFDGIFKSTDSTIKFDRLDSSGVLGGAHLGYNWHMAGLVVGIEGDIAGTGGWSSLVQAASSSEEAEAGVDLLASVRARVGVAVGRDSDVLLFATAGVAWIDADVLVCDDACNSSTVTSQKVSFSSVGGVFGAGFEWAATDNFRIRAETLYYVFDESKAITLSEANTGDNVGIDDAWTVRIGGSWYFK